MSGSEERIEFPRGQVRCQMLYYAEGKVAVHPDGIKCNAPLANIHPSPLGPGRGRDQMRGDCPTCRRTTFFVYAEM